MKDPEKLQKAIEESGDFIIFKIQPSNADLLNGGIKSGPLTSKSSNESKVKVTHSGGQQSTEEAFLLLTQQLQVRFLAFPRNFSGIV